MSKDLQETKSSYFVEIIKPLSIPFLTLAFCFALAFLANIYKDEISTFIAGNEKRDYDNLFTFNRRIVLYNGAKNDFIVKIEGKCYVKTEPSACGTEKYLVICRTGDNTSKQHSFGTSENISYFEEELDPQPVNVYNYKITYNPESSPSDIDLKMEEK